MVDRLLVTHKSTNAPENAAEIGPTVGKHSTRSLKGAFSCKETRGRSTFRRSESRNLTVTYHNTSAVKRRSRLHVGVVDACYQLTVETNSGLAHKTVRPDQSNDGLIVRSPRCGATKASSLGQAWQHNYQASPRYTICPLKTHTGRLITTPLSITNTFPVANTHKAMLQESSFVRGC